MSLMKFFRLIKKFWWLILLLLVVGGLLYMRSSNAKAKELKTKTYTVTKQDLVDSLEISGYIDANEKASLRFQTSGLLTWVGVKEGDSVKKFQVLASLDKRALKNSFQQVMNNYSKSREDFEQTQSNNKDWETIGMSDVAREAVKRTLSKEQADLNNAVLAVEAQDLALKFSNLYTPIAGIVTKIESPLAGQNITPATATFEVINPTTLYFSALADQTEVVKFSPGQKGKISLDAYPNDTIESMVTLVGFTPKTGSSGTMYEIKFAFDASNSGYFYKIGMTGDVSLIFGEKKQVLAIPEKYIKEKLGKKFVNIMENGKKKEIQIETGYSADGTVEVISGLKENELIYN